MTCCNAGNLAFPLLLVGGLFLLSRRGGGAGGPGGMGGNNPLQFGKSKAKFQMEPNTGVTFDDVAGVQEAKDDFMEVCIANEQRLMISYAITSACSESNRFSGRWTLCHVGNQA